MSSRCRYIVHEGGDSPAVASFPCADDRDDGAYEAATRVCDTLVEEYRQGYRDGQRMAATHPEQLRWESTVRRYVVTYIDDGWRYPTAACETCDEIHTGACHNPEASDEYE